MSEENAISKRVEVFKHMSMTLVNAIRKLGWSDRHGEIQYGNAAILCYLSSCKIPIKNLDPNKIERGKEFVERFLAKAA